MDLATYFVTALLFAAAPGPVTATIVLRALAGQARAAGRFAGGVLLGELATLAAALTVPPAWLYDRLGALEAVKWVAVAYVAMVALDLWRRAGAASAAVGALRHGAADWAVGFAISAANPYNIVFLLTVLPLLLRVEGRIPVVVAATLLPSVLVYGAAILGAGLMGRVSDRRPPLLDRGLALGLGSMAVWLAVD